MEKLVVPKFVAEYIEECGGTKPDVWDKADLIRDFDIYLERLGNSRLREWFENDYNFLMFINVIITNNYEVEEEKKYYWRKKKEHFLGFEYISNSYYVNYNVDDNKLSFDDREECYPYITKFTESEIIELVGEEGFKKLERVEFYE